MKRSIIIMLLLAGTLLAGCHTAGTKAESSTCESQYPARSSANNEYSHSDQPERFIYTVLNDQATTRLHLTFDQTEGSVAWTFTDPTGKVQWEGIHGEVGKFDEARDFDAIPGEWELTLITKNGSGTYEHCWMAK